MAFRSDLELLILAVLEQGSAHGYAIARSIHSRGDGALRVGEGQLYPVLHLLEREGCIRAFWEIQDGRPARKVYSLAEPGAVRLDQKKSDWAQFEIGVNRIIGRAHADAIR